MTITHQVTMDLTGSGAYERVDAVQDDRYSRNVELRLLENGAPWMIPENVQVIISYCKSDGTVGQYDVLPDESAAWSISENRLTIALAPQVLTGAGGAIMSVRMLQNQKVLNTFAFIVNVRANLAAEMPETEGGMSEDYLNVVFAGKLDRSGWAANMYLGTDGDGNVVALGAVDALPAVTDADEGKFLRVCNGVWEAQGLENAEEVAY